MDSPRFGPQFHDPAFECPAPDCDKEFDTEHGRAVHYGHVHADTTPEVATCGHCETEFEVPPESNGKFCSRECYRAGTRNRVTLTCAQCGDPFEVKANRAPDRTYCSYDCYGRSQRRQEQRECPACGRGFRVNVRNQIRYCSHACQAEYRTAKPRPADIDGMLWLLYVYEGHNARETWLRTNVNLNPDDQLTLKETRERLRENHWMRGGGVARYENLTIEDVGLDDDEHPQESTWQKYYQPGSDGGESA